MGNYLSTCFPDKQQTQMSTMSDEDEGCITVVVNEDTIQCSQNYVYLLQSAINRSRLQQGNQESMSRISVGVGLTVFQMQTRISSIKFVKKQLESFADFKQIAIKNHYLLIQELSENRQSFEYIAKHFHQSVTHQDNKLHSFTFKIEKGHEQFKTTKQYNPVEQLKKGNAEEIVNFIQCLIKGIIEFQSKYIFHPDLGLRNIIRRKIKHLNKYIYKIIDFGYAFKVKKEKQFCQLFSCTQQIIRYCLNLNLEYFTGYLFFRCQDIDRNLLRNLRQIITSKEKDEVKVQKISELLFQFSLLSHKKQFQDILNQVLDSDLFPQINHNELNRSIEAISVTDINDNKKGYLRTLNLVKDSLAKRSFTSFSSIN